MTPKEKAKELVDKYFEFMHHINPWDKAKQCALIAVDEILNVTHSDKRANSPFDKEYWQKVKIEIEKL